MLSHLNGKLYISSRFLSRKYTNSYNAVSPAFSPCDVLSCYLYWWIGIEAASLWVDGGLGLRYSIIISLLFFDYLCIKVLASFFVEKHNLKITTLINDLIEKCFNCSFDADGFGSVRDPISQSYDVIYILDRVIHSDVIGLILVWTGISKNN